MGDAYAGETFRRDFEAEGIGYTVASSTTSDNYESLEPKLNASEVELLDVPALTEQLMGLVMRGRRVTHTSGEHDDWSCAPAGALLWLGSPTTATASSPTCARTSSSPALCAEARGYLGTGSDDAPRERCPACSRPAA